MEEQKLNAEDWEDKTDNQSEYIISQLDMLKWQTEPEAKKEYDDINKDSVLGNLNPVEMLSIKYGENVIACITAMRSMMPNEEIRDYFFPDNIIKTSYRKKSSTLALSCSKEGFLRRLLRTGIEVKEEDVKQFLTQDEEKKKMFGFFRKKPKQLNERWG